LYTNIFDDEDYDLKKLEDTEKILNHLHNVPPNRRKTILSALVVLTDNTDYRKLMLDDIREYNKDIHKQEKTESQQESWIGGEEINELWEELYKEASFLYRKKHLKISDLQAIQSLIILSLLGGMFIPPRRSLDYCDFYIKDINKDKNNYIDKNELVFNRYKTSKFYGQQRIAIPKQLKAILTKWISVNPTNTLLFDKNLNPLTSVKLNQRLNRMFGERNIGVNQMRHTYLTDKYKKHMEESKEIEKTTEEMGTSPNMLLTYVKN
jgi:integrase